MRALAEKMSASALFFVISGARERSYFAFALDRLEKHKNDMFCILGRASEPRSIMYAPSWGIIAKKYCICPSGGTKARNLFAKSDSINLFLKKCRNYIYEYSAIRLTPT